MASYPTNGDDSILGTTGPDSVAALDGRDTMRGQDGNDTPSGGDGNDVKSMAWFNITSIRSIWNRHASERFFIRNRERPGQTTVEGQRLEIAPGESINCDVWISWCNSAEDFVKKYILVAPTRVWSSVDGTPPPTTFGLWQQGDYVRFDRRPLAPVWSDNGAWVPGLNRAGGDRSLHIFGTNPYNSSIQFYIG